MAHVNDAWYVERRQLDGTTRRHKTPRHGLGKRWIVRWRDHAGEDRKQFFDRKSDAEQAAARLDTELARRTYIDPRAGEIAFRDYAEQWRLGQFADPNTAYQVRARLQLHVYPKLGNLALQVITPSHIRSWLRGLTVSLSYQRTLFANVSQIFTAAVADDILAKNPCANRTVRKPVADPQQIVPWTARQVTEVHRALPDRYAILALLAAGTGLRQGEMLALSAADIDLDRRSLQVRRQIKLTPGNQPYFALPKGRKIRTVPLPDSMRDALAEHLARFPARSVTLGWDGTEGKPTTAELILTTRERKPVNRHYFNAKIWKPALTAAGIAPTRENGCHSLRHYYASVLLDGGESIKTVSERLGHADPGFTLRTYTHLLPQSDTRTRDIIDTAFRALPPRRPTSGAPAAHARHPSGPTRPRRAPGYFGPQG
ncbi:tyrosine-type recombinase/integrase [Pseudonocardia abyssalis]|uniref:Site-specific integrase n=1 Tax=Pseudonocardia abyssalis TaxID=2792008 RepID=A0ABS6UMH8_9PSEU|nr:site-specific integrase [Pseudonocardia abyssalis]MBW0116353.1 site-specific integrase [Pseudonocardia abyssalis]MBW0133136.1 site-specific integrase [Pseudonocardia abyssalis]